MATPTLTTLQIAMLNKIARSEFSRINGGYPETLDDVGEVWANCTLQTKADGGVFTTLAALGLVDIYKAPRNARRGGNDDSTVWLTETGFAAYKANVAQTAEDAECVARRHAYRAKEAAEMAAYAAKHPKAQAE